ncbi:MAG: hypothetical protein FJ144_07965 [Deltaproteobacteria bacterium]|nr:hypothetical protein [Deltaproteobacteria bacterium]
MLRARLPSLLVLAVALGCAARASAPVDPELSHQLEKMKEAAAAPAMPEPAPAEAEKKPQPVTPPRSPATRIARARTALPPGGGDSPLKAVSDDSPYVVGLLAGGASPETRSRATALLIDVGHEPAVLVGRHDFDARVTKLEGALDLRTEAGEPLVLAVMTGPGATTACGWLLAEKRPRFLCAPKLSAPSRYDVIAGELVESWEATFPPPDLVPGARTGRVMRFATTGWDEVDGFRCLARPLDESVLASGPGELRRWQRDTVARLAKAARRANDALHKEEAERFLHDAIAADACDEKPWRLLGRLEFESGQAAKGAPSLAVAVALESYEAAPLVDLADALADLETSNADDQAAFESTRKILERPASIRPLAERAKDPHALARSLYQLYLERTSEAAAMHEPRRRRVESQLRTLR